MKNINGMPNCYLRFGLTTGDWVVDSWLPRGVALTAGEDENDYAIVDISHWTQDDLDAFDAMELGEQLPIIESLEFAEFGRQMAGK